MNKPTPIPAARPWQIANGKYWYLPPALILMTTIFLTGLWYGQGKAARQQVTRSQRILHYVDPMNPAHISPEPGLAPSGMNLEPVYADDEGKGSGSAVSPGTGRVSSTRQQQLGVRIATVEPSPWTYEYRTVGKVAVDESRTYRLNAFIEGWIVKVFNDTVGSLIRKDEPLATYFNRDLPVTLKNYYYTIDFVNQKEKERALDPKQRDLLMAQKLEAERDLMSLGMSKPAIDSLAHSRELPQEITIAAPATSFVLARNVTLGQRFAAAEELYRLADLSRVWIIASLNENVAQHIRPGEKAAVTLPNQAEPRPATVSEVLPLFDPEAQSLKVRLEMDNPNYALTPGMLVDVEFPIKMPAAVNVPIAAVVDSGLGQTVFIERGNGFFEPRQVKIGWRLGDRVEILAGLKSGERIAISGNFLVDSESRMKMATAGFLGKGAAESVCPLDLSKTKIQAQGTAETVKDPVCGLTVAVERAQQAGRISDYQGKTYYFDLDGCKQRFDHNPQRYLSGSPDKTFTSWTSLSDYPAGKSGSYQFEQYKRDARALATKEALRSGSQLPIEQTLPQLPSSTASKGEVSTIPPEAQVVPPETTRVKPPEPGTPFLQPKAPQ